MTAVATPHRAWFDEAGWKLEPADLRAALEERGADTDTIVELLDEGADRRRAQPVTHERPSESSSGSATSSGERPQEPAAGGVSAQNLEAEEHVLGAIMLSPAALPACRDVLRDDGADFWLGRNARVWRAAIRLADQAKPHDVVMLIDELERTHELQEAGGRIRLHELAAIVPASANAAHYARIIARAADRREAEKVGLRLVEAARNGGIAADLRDAIIRIVEQPATEGPPPEATDGGAFVFDEPTDPAAIRLWGDETQIGWASGEGFMLVGPDGVGKTTLGQQLALARCGLRGDVLGMPVQGDERRVLLIAADRPRQAARSMRRMVGDLDRPGLDERMAVWRGPLPAMLNEDRLILARLAKQFGAGTVVVDSLKDVAVDVATDEAGGRIAACFQHLIASGVELLCMHHPRKPGIDQHRKPKELADVYGSRLIFGAFGSVIMLWGNPGDPIVELSHLKQPVDELGPWNIHHDHQAGRTTVERGTDLVQLVLNAGTAGLTAAGAAGLVYQKDDPDRNQVERTRSKLKRLCKAGRVVEIPGRSGSAPGQRGGAAEAALYVFNGPTEALL